MGHWFQRPEGMRQRPPSQPHRRMAYPVVRVRRMELVLVTALRPAPKIQLVLLPQLGSFPRRLSLPMVGGQKGCRIFRVTSAFTKRSSVLLMTLHLSGRQSFHVEAFAFRIFARSHDFLVCPLPPSPFHYFFHSTVGAFVAPGGADRAATALQAERREFLSAAAAAAGIALTPLAANAIRDYENVGLLGGSEVVDVNNANVRVYLKMPGLYPNVAGKIASNGPYNSVSDLYNIPGLSGKEKELIKKYESRFTAKAPQADYVIDRINNGLYK